MNLVKNKHGRGEEGQQAMNSEFAVPHSALSSEPSRVSWNGTIELSEEDQAVVFGFYCLVFLLPLNVLQQLLLLKPGASWPLKKTVNLLTVKRIFCLK